MLAQSPSPSLLPSLASAVMGNRAAAASKTDTRNAGKIAVQALKHQIDEINSILKESPSKDLIILRGGEEGGGRGMGVIQNEKEGGGGRGGGKGGKEREKHGEREAGARSMRGWKSFRGRGREGDGGGGCICDDYDDDDDDKYVDDEYDYNDYDDDDDDKYVAGDDDDNDAGDYVDDVYDDVCPLALPPSLLLPSLPPVSPCLPLPVPLPLP